MKLLDYGYSEMCFVVQKTMENMQSKKNTTIVDLAKEEFALIFAEKVLYDKKEYRFLSWKGK